MPIDASIALRGKLPELDSPLTMLAQVSQLKQAQQKNRLAEMAYGEKQREVEQTNALSEAYKTALNPDGTTDRNKLYSSVAGAGLGAKLPGIQKGYADQDKSAMEATKAKLEAGLKHFEVIGQVMAGVNDQASYDAARQQTAQIFGPEAAAKLPAQYDPALIARNQAQALTVKARLEQQWKGLEFGQKEKEFAYRQGNDAANRGVTIRGQDLSQGTAIRGQDITVRGQNMTNDRARDFNDIKREDGKDKPLTEFQGKSTGFAARAQEADKLVASLDGKYSPAAINSKAMVESTPLIGGAMGAAVNKFSLSQKDQQAEQAQRDFINAILRQESGAAIGKDEFDSARKQYFDQPGDGADVKMQKARNRALAIEGLKASAGPGAAKLEGMVEVAGKTSAVAKAAAKSGDAANYAPKPGTVEGGYRFKGGNPSDSRAWEKV